MKTFVLKRVLFSDVPPAEGAPVTSPPNPAPTTPSPTTTAAETAVKEGEQAAAKTSKLGKAGKFAALAGLTAGAYFIGKKMAGGGSSSKSSTLGGGSVMGDSMSMLNG